MVCPPVHLHVHLNMCALFHSVTTTKQGVVYDHDSIRDAEMSGGAWLAWNMCLACSRHMTCNTFLSMSLVRIQPSVLPGKKKSSSVVLTQNTAGLVCPKCGIAKISGRLSCCARGGAWLRKCGDAGDSNFDHTWIEGIRACQSEFPRVPVLRMNVWWLITRGATLAWLRYHAHLSMYLHSQWWLIRQP